MGVFAWTKHIRNLLSRWSGQSNVYTTGGDPAIVDRDEEITTFVRYERHLNKATGLVKHEHFQPRLINGRLEISVYRTEGLSDAELWALCAEFFEKPSGHKAKARGFAPAAAIYDAHLSFDADGKPHPLHANVIGWSADLTKKHAWKQQALMLAQHFHYQLRQPAA